VSARLNVAAYVCSDYFRNFVATGAFRATMITPSRRAAFIWLAICAATMSAHAQTSRQNAEFVTLDRPATFEIAPNTGSLKESVQKGQQLVWHHHVHFTPTSASWINQVERWFAELTRKRLRRGVHTSVSQLEADIHSFIERHNQNPRPFKWTKSADQILASVKRFCHKAQQTLCGEL
jgi:hypothetical protein